MFEFIFKFEFTTSLGGRLVKINEKLNIASASADASEDLSADMSEDRF